MNRLKNKLLLIAVISVGCSGIIPKQVAADRQDDKYAQGTRHFYFQSITDANVNIAFHASIPKADPFGNSLRRKAMIDQFFTRIDTLLVSNSKIQTGKRLLHLFVLPTKFKTDCGRWRVVFN